MAPSVKAWGCIFRHFTFYFGKFSVGPSVWHMIVRNSNFISHYRFAPTTHRPQINALISIITLCEVPCKFFELKNERVTFSVVALLLQHTFVAVCILEKIVVCVPVFKRNDETLMWIFFSSFHKGFSFCFNDRTKRVSTMILNDGSIERERAHIEWHVSTKLQNV